MGTRGTILLLYGEKQKQCTKWCAKSNGGKAKLEHIFSLLTPCLGTQSKKLINYPINVVIIAEKMQV